MASTHLPSRRSPCPVACALDLFGDRWTLLVIRDLMLGRSRFKEFLHSPEKITTNILSERLQRLTQRGLIVQIPAEEGGKRMAYQLTEKGESLRPIMRAIRDWGLEWEEGTHLPWEEGTHLPDTSQTTNPIDSGGFLDDADRP